MSALLQQAAQVDSELTQAEREAAIEAELSDLERQYGDPFEWEKELSPLEQELRADFEARELASARREGAETRRDFAETLRGNGIDIVDHIHELGIALDSPQAEHIAKAAGYHTNTWDDQRNVTRRQKERDKNCANYSKRQRLQQQANGKASKATTPEPAAIDDGLPTIPSTTDRAALETWARDYCRALVEKYQSAKMHLKLFGRPENPDSGSLNWQVSMMPKNDCELATWATSAKLSFDKKIGC